MWAANGLGQIFGNEMIWAVKMERRYLEVGYKKGEMDFGINMSIKELSLEEMKKFREMCCVAIHVAEESWAEARKNCTEMKEKRTSLEK